LATETLITSEPILAEFEKNLREKARVPENEAVEARRQAETNATLVIPTASPDRISRDPTADVILGTAVAAGADLVVTGDKDLLVLGHYEGIPIVTPTDCLARLTG
jgi:putative PIN family toxin of toxin-antitoxin system